MYPDRAIPGKLILKKAISEISFRLRSPFRNRVDANNYRVLNYHSISDDFLNDDIYAQMTTPKKSFDDQLKFIKENRYNVLSCDEVVCRVMENVPMPPRAICITFDDGFKDNLTNGLPILEKYGFKATIFLTVDYIGKSRKYMNWDSIKLLSNTKLVSFGAHSLSHRRLRDLSLEELERELVVSKKVLEENLMKKVDLFAYPFGSYDSFDLRAEKVLKSGGYKAAFTTIAGLNTPKTNLFRLRRTRISWYDDKKEFKKELEGDYDWYSVWQMAGRTA